MSHLVRIGDEMILESRGNMKVTVYEIRPMGAVVIVNERDEYFLVSGLTYHLPEKR